MPFDLIIWDCDGCLVDSEAIACGVRAEDFSARGYPVTTQEFINKFSGYTNDYALQIIRQETGLDLEDPDNHEKVRANILLALHAALKPNPILNDIVRSLPKPQCVASGSVMERVEKTLQWVGLYEEFKGRIFSGFQVKNRKPAPDIFLFAAAQMGVEPSRCLVIEDSVAGVTAARAAGMTVFAYMGGSHVNDAWRARVAAAGPDALFDDMRQLPEMIEEMERKTLTQNWGY